MLQTNYGAAPADWNHFDLILGLGEDLLPVVSNPGATISPNSKMAGLGKTPSRYNKSRQVAGIADWTSHVATYDVIGKWSAEPDYGICVQTRTVRAIDCDVEGSDFAAELRATIYEQLGHLKLPMRWRQNADKFLLAFRLPGDMQKRVIKTAHGIIEFLATGQQFIASGTHPSGARYEWRGGLPVAIPEITLEQFESLWSKLETKFGIEPSTTSTSVAKSVKIAEAASNDPTAVALYGLNMVLSAERDGRLHITCPFEEEHSGPGSESATTYFPAFTNGFQRGHFKCLHAHCLERTDHGFLEALGLTHDMADDYDVIIEAEVSEVISPDGTVTTMSTSNRYPIVKAHEFSAGSPAGWWIKGLIPKADLGVVYGPPASGKSFWVLDLVMAIARGEDWCGMKTHRGRVVYVVAEGAGGFRNRIQAYEMEYGYEPGGDIGVVAGVPNLTKREDVVELGNSINRNGGADILVYDTLARGTSGADENSAKDMGVAIENCRVLRQATGAMPLLVHHSGKDASKGARGSNSILGAVDFEIEISRFDNNRTATVRKMKDGSDLEQYGFKLKTLQIGMDEDGDEISSCVVEHGAVVAPTKGQKGLKKNTAEVWNVLHNTISTGGENPTEARLREAYMETYPKDPTKAADRRGDYFMRGLKDLFALNMIAVIDGRIKPIQTEEA